MEVLRQPIRISQPIEIRTALRVNDITFYCGYTILTKYPQIPNSHIQPDFTHRTFEMFSYYWSRLGSSGYTVCIGSSVPPILDELLSPPSDGSLLQSGLSRLQLDSVRSPALTDLWVELEHSGTQTPWGNLDAHTHTHTQIWICKSRSKMPLLFFFRTACCDFFLSFH